MTAARRSWSDRLCGRLPAFACLPMATLGWFLAALVAPCFVLANEQAGTAATREAASVSSPSEALQTTSTGVAERDERQIRHVLSNILPAEPPYTLVLAPRGFSGLQTFEVLQGENHYFLKIAFDWSQVGSPDSFLAECRNAAWAAAAGLGPAVVAAAGEQGFLLSHFVENEQANWFEAKNEPRISATLQAMATLHRIAPAQNLSPVDVSALRKRLQKRANQLLDLQLSDQRLPQVFTFHEAFVAALEGMSFYKALCHGDLQQGNVLYAKGRSYFVDWGALAMADPMRELAKHLYNVDGDIEHVQGYAALYGDLSDADVHRCRLHLAVIHAEQFVETLIGMPWDRPERREEKLQRLFAWLQRDKVALEIDI